VEADEKASEAEAASSSAPGSGALAGPAGSNMRRDALTDTLRPTSRSGVPLPVSAAGSGFDAVSQPAPTVLSGIGTRIPMVAGPPTPQLSTAEKAAFEAKRLSPELPVYVSDTQTSNYQHTKSLLARMPAVVRPHAPARMHTHMHPSPHHHLPHPPAISLGVVQFGTDALPLGEHLRQYRESTRPKPKKKPPPPKKDAAAQPASSQ
jgi:hypothetical protein